MDVRGNASNEKRLIDAVGLRRRITAFATGLHSEVLPVDTVLMLLTQAQTVDSVPVVRCRECKYWNKDALACDTLPWENSSEHANWYENDFCSYGEQKGR